MRYPYSAMSLTPPKRQGKDIYADAAIHLCNSFKLFFFFFFKKKKVFLKNSPGRDWKLNIPKKRARPVYNYS
jgi:hypothetical protein